MSNPNRTSANESVSYGSEWKLVGEFKMPRAMTALLQGFAAISGFLCNIGAYVQNKADLKELDLYTDELERLNNYFLGLEILQCTLLPICLYFIATKNLYGHIAIMWLEDVFLEIPLVWISFHITSHTNETITVLLVLAGGSLQSRPGG